VPRFPHHERASLTTTWSLRRVCRSAPCAAGSRTARCPSSSPVAAVHASSFRRMSLSGYSRARLVRRGQNLCHRHLSRPLRSRIRPAPARNQDGSEIL